MKLATWNLQRPVPRSRARYRAIGEWLGRINTDIWVLTETHDGIGPGPDYATMHTRVADRPQEEGER